MKPFALTLFLLLSVSSPTFAQPAALESSDEIATSDSKEAFDRLKTLAGSWVGPLTSFPAYPEMAGTFVQVSLRVTSRGNALMHEMAVSGLPDHPVTMFHLDEDRLVATHYCDAGNRPRLVAKVSPDGNTVEFDFLDLSGGDQYGHMQHVVFTFIDENHHTEDWTFMMPNGESVRGHFDLQRTNFEGDVTAKSDTSAY